MSRQRTQGIFIFRYGRSMLRSFIDKRQDAHYWAALLIVSHPRQPESWLFLK
jgi:hypothetical protein